VKKILITGANSYIGTSFENYMKQWADECQVDTVDMIGGAWRSKSFSGYDTVFHVAGIAHVSKDPKMEDLYFWVNRDLTIETAQKAKNDGVKQFVFMSSIIVYGESIKIGPANCIAKQTPPAPSSFYGESKLQAEAGILPLQCEDFNVAIIRPPMIYGNGCKGNYQMLSKIARKLPIFPAIKNCRSMLYIGNLCEFLRLLMNGTESGLFFPQNDEYVCTCDMVKRIGQAHNKKIRLIRLLNPLVKLAGLFIGTAGKAFGNLQYDRELSRYHTPYCKFNFAESIDITEGQGEPEHD